MRRKQPHELPQPWKAPRHGSPGATATLYGIDNPEAERTSRRKVLFELNAKLAEAIQQREEIAATVPNLETVAAALERAHSIVTRAEDDRQRIRLELGKLDTSIEIQAGEAVDEELADVDVRLKSGTVCAL